MAPARWARRSAAVLLTLAAPAISFSGALTTGLKGTSPAVHFPPGYGVSLTATVAATTLAAVLAALIARRDALIAIPVSLGIWFITGLSVIAAAAQLGHTGLALWGVILIAASLIGAAAGMLLAARRGRAGSRPARASPSPASHRGPSQLAELSAGRRMPTERRTRCPAHKPTTISASRRIPAERRN
jgi:hypothetical protein